jgi:hypothetical protein
MSEYQYYEFQAIDRPLTPEEQKAAADDWMRSAIAQLPREDCDAFLLRLAQGEPPLALALKTRLRAFAGHIKA